MEQKQDLNKSWDSGELPLGLAMALAQNPEAMSAFSFMDPETRRSVIRAAHSVNSKQEMRQYVQAIANRTEKF